MNSKESHVHPVKTKEKSQYDKNKIEHLSFPLQNQSYINKPPIFLNSIPNPLPKHTALDQNIPSIQNKDGQTKSNQTQQVKHKKKEHTHTSSHVTLNSSNKQPTQKPLFPQPYPLYKLPHPCKRHQTTTNKKRTSMSQFHNHKTLSQHL